MDQSSNQSMNGAHLHQNHNGSFQHHFIDEMQAYAASGEGSGNDGLNDFAWDPELFHNADTSAPSFHQQPQQPTSTFSQTMMRQSDNSPALPQYQPAQQSLYPQQSNNYGSSFYNSQNTSQSPYDERFMPRPSASPAPFDQYAYQPNMTYGGQQYGQMAQQFPPRQTSTPVSQYSQRQPQPQQSHQYMNIVARPSPQLSQARSTDTAPFPQFSPQQHTSHTFVNPSMLSAAGMAAMNGSNAGMHHRQAMQPSPYFTKAGTTVDPQMLQQMQTAHISPTPTPQPHVASINSYMPNAQGVPMMQVVNKPVTIEGTAKKPKTKVNKPKSSSAAKDKGEMDSADDLEIEEDPAEPKPALLVVSCPSDDRGKALYNAVQAVWFPRNRTATAEVVRTGIGAFGETVRSLRDSWKEVNDALKKAELPNSTTADQAPHLKKEVERYRQVMESVMSRSLLHGHDSIVKRLGDNPFTTSAIYSFMMDRFNAGDYNSSLVSSIFKLAVKFTIDEEALEAVKWTKILDRFSKRATNESKDLAKQILANAAAESTRKKTVKAEEGPASPGSQNGGIKRTRDGDSVGPAPKKVVRQASKPLALQHAERRKAQEKEASLKAAANKNAKAAGSDGKTAGNARPKVALTAPLKANAYASLLSASKKPGTSIAEKAAQTAVKDKAKPATTAPTNGTLSGVKKEEVRKESPPRNLSQTQSAKSASSLLGFLADMEKPKNTEVKKTEVAPDETEEQRTKRLRKEARRTLRVSWKSDSELVETRLFTHDPDEETGHADSMMRDAGDTVKEGEMLKLHKGAEDLEDDEDEESSDDLGTYSTPTEVDLSPIAVDGVENFVKFGGPKKPESAASEAQNKYEENTLMVIYVFKSDRPETPKELPTVNDEDDFSPSIDFGEPDANTRKREQTILGQQSQPAQPQAPVSNGLDLAAQLRAITQQQSQAQSGIFNADMQRTLGLFGQPNLQPAQAPAAPTGGVDIAKLLAVVQQAQQQPQQQAQPPPQPQYAPAATPAPAPGGVAPSLAALVAQFANGQQPQALPIGNSSNPNPFPGSSDFGRKHGRGDDVDSHGNRKKKKVPLGPDGKPLNYKTQVCSYWLEGKCAKGKDCTYRHDE